MCKGVGVRFADLIKFLSNTPWKWGNLVSLRPNYFIFIGYLKTGDMEGVRAKPLNQWTPSGTATDFFAVYLVFSFIFQCYPGVFRLFRSKSISNYRFFLILQILQIFLSGKISMLLNLRHWLSSGSGQLARLALEKTNLQKKVSSVTLTIPLRLGPICKKYCMVCFLFVWFDSLRPINNLSVKQARVFLGWTSTKLGLMCLAQGPQRSDAGEARTRGLSVSGQALYHRATALSCCMVHVGDLRLSRSIIRKSRFIFLKERRTIWQKSGCLNHSNERIFQVIILMQWRIKDSCGVMSYV